MPDDPIESDFLGDIPDTVEEISGYGTISFGDPEPEPVRIEPGTLSDSPFEESPVTIGDGSCIICGEPTFRPPGLTRAGRRKRVPRYCDIHNPANRRKESDDVANARLESQLARVQEELADDLRLLGTLAGPLLPTTGYFVIVEADAFTVALLKLCKNNTRMLRILHRVASVAPVYEVAKFGAGVGYAIQVDTQGADPHTTVGQRLGVARCYDAINEVVLSDKGNNNTNGSANQRPPRYATLQ